MTAKVSIIKSLSATQGKCPCRRSYVYISVFLFLLPAPLLLSAAAVKEIVVVAADKAGCSPFTLNRKTWEPEQRKKLAGE